MSSSGGFTEGLFSWLNEFFAWLFSLGMGGKLTWITKYWPMLVLIIAGFVVLMDLLVWFIRYRPYRKWKRAWDSILGRSHTTRPVEFTRREAKEKKPRTRYDIPLAPIAKEKRDAQTPSTMPLPRAAREEDLPTAPAAARAPAKALDVPTIGRRAQKQSIVEMPKRGEAARHAASASATKPAPKPAVKIIPPAPAAPAPADDDAPTLRP